MNAKSHLAYLKGIALGDGNISNPNGRAFRMRITCDLKYPKIIDSIQKSIAVVFPKNKISLIKRKGCLDISFYSNLIPEIFGWTNYKGTKLSQKIKIENWLFKDLKYSKYFLKGLLESDGSIYQDRNYTMINFVNYNKDIALSCKKAFVGLGFEPRIYKVSENGKNKYTVRLSKRVAEFLKKVPTNKI